MGWQDIQGDIQRRYQDQKMAEENLHLMQESNKNSKESLNYAQLSYKSAEKTRKIANMSFWIALGSLIISIIALFK